nr:PREDICTED: uncharacterized protein LOC108201685 [Daucus carota subsp. sativus]
MSKMLIGCAFAGILTIRICMSIVTYANQGSIHLVPTLMQRVHALFFVITARTLLARSKLRTSALKGISSSRGCTKILKRRRPLNSYRLRSISNFSLSCGELLGDEGVAITN